MYPRYDFRYLVTMDPSRAIIMLGGESFTEVLSYWKQTNRPTDKLSIYQLGIEQAIASDRYSISVLTGVINFPEFYPAVKQGLARLWTGLTFYLSCDTLFIDRCNHCLLSCSNQEKLGLLGELSLGHPIHLLVGENWHQISVVLSPKAQEIICLYSQL